MEDEVVTGDTLKIIGPHSRRRERFASLVIFDTEATGLSKRTRITELCMLSVQTGELKSSGRPRVINKLQLCVNPQTAIAPEASRLTGLFNDALEQMPIFRDQASVISSFLACQPQPSCIIAHNGHGFDFPLLQAELRKAQQALPAHTQIWCADSLQAFRVLDGLPAVPEWVVQRQQEETQRKARRSCVASAVRNETTRDKTLCQNNSCVASAVRNETSRDKTLCQNNSCVASAVRNETSRDKTLCQNNSCVASAVRNETSRDKTLCQNNSDTSISTATSSPVTSTENGEENKPSEHPQEGKTPTKREGESMDNSTLLKCPKVTSKHEGESMDNSTLLKCPRLASKHEGESMDNSTLLKCPRVASKHEGESMDNSTLLKCPRVASKHEGESMDNSTLLKCPRVASKHEGESMDNSTLLKCPRVACSATAEFGSQLSVTDSELAEACDAILDEVPSALDLGAVAPRQIDPETTPTKAVATSVTRGTGAAHQFVKRPNPTTVDPSDREKVTRRLFDEQSTQILPENPGHYCEAPNNDRIQHSSQESLSDEDIVRFAQQADPGAITSPTAPASGAGEPAMPSVPSGQERSQHPQSRPSKTNSPSDSTSANSETSVTRKRSPVSQHRARLPSPSSSMATSNSPQSSSSTSSTTSQRVSYKLMEIYRREFGQYPVISHTAEEDCVTLLKLIERRSLQFMKYVETEAVPFSSVEPMF